VIALGGSPTPEAVEAQLASTAHDLGEASLYGSGLVDADAATAP
jgi:hypothetical protein